MVRPMIAVVFAAMVLGGCAGKARERDAASAAARDPQPAPAAAPEQDAEAALVSALIGKSYVRGQDFPGTVAGDWQVSTAIPLPGKKTRDLLAISKDGRLVLASAAAAAALRNGRRFEIRDAWMIADQDGLVDAACATRPMAQPSILALVDPADPPRIVLAVQLEHGSDKLAEIEAGGGKRYRCRYRQGKYSLTRMLAW